MPVAIYVMMFKNILFLMAVLSTNLNARTAEGMSKASNTVFEQPPDSIPLPIAEITSTRLLRHAIGQSQVTFDSLTLTSYQARSISDLISENTTLDVRVYGHGLSTLTTRGGGSAHTAYLWNGINIQNSMSGVLDLTLIPLSGIGKMGYKNGGESALFGGGALSGVLFFDHEISKKKGFHASFNTVFGSFDDFRQQGHLSLGNGRIATQISVVHQQADNDFPFRNIARISSPIQKQVNAAMSALSILHHVYVQINPRTVVKTHLWVQEMERQIAPTMTVVNTAALQNDRSWRGLVEIAHHTRSKGVWHSRFALMEDLLLYQSQVVPLSTNRVKNRLAELEYEGNFLSNWAFRAGVNYTQNAAKSNNYNTKHSRDRVALFFSQHATIKSVKVGFNIRQETVNGQLIPTTASIGVEQRTKALNHKYAVCWRGSAGKNYNLPGLNDLYWDILGNPNLVPEHSWSGELGADFLTLPSTDQAIWNKALHLTIYTMRIQDRILWAPGTDGLWRPSNLYQSKSKGLELAASTNTKIQWGHLQVRAGYQYCHAVNKEGFQLIYVPKHQGNANITLSNANWSLQWRQIAGGSRFMNADNSAHTKAFHLSNVEAQWNPPFARKRINIALLVQNLFNTDYQVIQYYAMPRRSFRLQVGIYF